MKKKKRKFYYDKPIYESDSWDNDTHYYIDLQERKVLTIYNSFEDYDKPSKQEWCLEDYQNNITESGVGDDWELKERGTKKKNK